MALYVAVGSDSGVSRAATRGEGMVMTLCLNHVATLTTRHHRSVSHAAPLL
jgi:hypothetical protein